MNSIHIVSLISIALLETLFSQDYAAIHKELSDNSSKSPTVKKFTEEEVKQLDQRGKPLVYTRNNRLLWPKVTGNALN